MTSGAILLTWLANRLGGSSLTVAVWHGTFNLVAAAAQDAIAVVSLLVARITDRWNGRGGKRRVRQVLNQIGNPFVRAILRLPLHGLLSGSVLLITVTGRRSGRRYTLPVQYARRGDAVYVVSPREHRWWRNLDGGAPVALRLRGRTLAGEASVLAGDEAATAKDAFAGTALERAARVGRDAVVVRVRDLRPLAGHRAPDSPGSRRGPAAPHARAGYAAARIPTPGSPPARGARSRAGEDRSAW